MSAVEIGSERDNKYGLKCLGKSVTTATPRQVAGPFVPSANAGPSLPTRFLPASIPVLALQLPSPMLDSFRSESPVFDSPRAGQTFEIPSAWIRAPKHDHGHALALP